MKNVWIVDDDRSIRWVLEKALTRAGISYASFTNADDALKLGMSATVRLDLAATQAIVVPNTALYTRDSTPRVWVVDRSSETVRAIDVKLGESTAEQT